jgi:succinoglycan biosynthesis transport protein ExoP
MSAPLDSNPLLPVPLPVGPGGPTTTVLLPRYSEPAGPLPPGLVAAPSMEGLWHAIRRRWVLALCLGLLAGLLGAIIASFVMPAQYSAVTLLHLEPRPPRGIYEGEGEFLNYQRTQLALLRSFPVIHSALDKPGVSDLPEVRAHPDTMDWLNKAMVTDVLLGPEIIRVTLNGDRAEDVAVLLNEVTRAYLRESAGKDEAKVRARIQQLQQNYKSLAENLREKRAKLLSREEELGLDDPQTVIARLQSKIQQQNIMQQQQVQNQMDGRRTEVDLVALRAKVAAPDKIVISDFALGEEYKQDTVIRKLTEQLAVINEQLQREERIAPIGVVNGSVRTLQREQAGIQERLLERQKSIRPDIERRLRSRIVTEARDKIAELERHLSLTKEQDRAMDNEVKKLDTQIATLRGANRPLEKSSSDVEALRDEVTQMEVVLKRVGEELGAWQSELPITPRVTQLESAKVPQAKKRDRQIKAAIAAGLGMFGLVFFGLGLWEFRARRVSNSDDVVQGLGMPLVGIVPALPPVRRAFPVQPVALLSEQSALTEAIDGVRTRLLHAASRNDSLRVIMVASAIGGEGKTSLASQLAASLARGGRKTLLVDCDLRNPAAHRQFGLPVGPGLSEVLRGETTLKKVVHATPIDGLSLLPAGSSDLRAVRALSQVDLSGLFAHFKTEYDFVVVDVCPVLPVSDALVVGRHADAVLFAVLRNVSRLPAVYEAQKRLSSVDIPTLGAVVLGEQTETYGTDRYLAKLKV